MSEPRLYEKPPLVTVFGGTGFVGRYVTETLTKRGYRVRIAARYPEKAYYMRQIGAVGQTQTVKANVGDKAAVARALQDAAAAVYLPGLLYPRGKNSLRKVNVEGAENVARQALRAGISLIHISALSAGLGRKTAYLRSKAQGEERVRAAHKKAIILRPSVIFGPEDKFFNRFANWSRFTPILPLFGGGKAQFQPVYVGDVAEMIARAADGALAAGKIYELGGQDVLSFRALMEEMLRIIRRRRAFISLPMPIAVAWGGIWGALGKIPFVPVVTTAGETAMLGCDSTVSAAAQREGRSLAGAGIAARGLDIILPAYLSRFRVCGQFSKVMS